MTPGVSPTHAVQSRTSKSSKGFRWEAWSGGVLVVAVSIAAFLPVLQNDFVNWDDVANFVGNPYFRGLGWTNLRWMFTKTHVGHYDPLTWVSHGLDYLLWGLNPRGYHLGNLLLHAANAALFYLAARRLLAAAFGASLPQGKRRDEQDPALWAGAVLAALIFAVHPLRVESVAWATERRDVLCGLFYLLAGLAYLRGVEGGGPIRKGWWALSVGAFVLALLSKAAAMPLPAALLLLDVYPLRRLTAVGWRRLVAEKIPYVILDGGAALAALVAQSQASALTGYQQYGIGSRVGMTAYSLVFYPLKFFYWADLSPLYELRGTVDPLAAPFLLSMIGLVIVTVVLVVLRWRWPALLAAWVYSVLLVLPVSGIVHAGVQLVADRYSYLSGLGFALLVGAALMWILEVPGGPRASVVGACALVAVFVVVGLATATWRQSKVWLDTGTLWRHVLSLDSRNAHAHYYLGNWLKATERPQEARAEYERAFELADRADLKTASLNGVTESLRRMAGSLNNQGVALAEKGELESARGSFLEALRVFPRFPDACKNLRRLAGMIRVDAQELRNCPE